MPRTSQIYGHIESKTDLGRVFRAIRHDVEDAGDRAALTEIYKRAGYLITLTYAPSWQEKWGQEADELRERARDEFGRTARKINQRARAIGTEPDYDEKWGK